MGTYALLYYNNSDPAWSLLRQLAAKPLPRQCLSGAMSIKHLPLNNYCAGHAYTVYIYNKTIYVALYYNNNNYYLRFRLINRSAKYVI